MRGFWLSPPDIEVEVRRPVSQPLTNVASTQYEQLCALIRIVWWTQSFRNKWWGLQLMRINGKPLPITTQILDATLVFILQFFLLIPIFVYLGESCVILVHINNKLYFWKLRLSSVRLRLPTSIMKKVAMVSWCLLVTLLATGYCSATDGMSHVKQPFYP